MSAITYPRYLPRRGQVRPSSWWGRAWVRALEETAYAEVDLRSGRSLARRGAVGQLTVEPGEVVAAVEEGQDAWTVDLGVEQLTEPDRALFTELVAAESGRAAGLLDGQLPHALVEDGEEVGLELLPFSGDLGATCSCDHWTDPCRHALAVGYQVGWLLDRDPFVLLHLRGVVREELLAGLHALTVSVPAAGSGRVGASAGLPGGSERDDADLASAAEAAERARRVLALIEQGLPFEHLF